MAQIDSPVSTILKNVSIFNKLQPCEGNTVTILEGAEVRIGFYGRGGRDPPRGHSRGFQRPRGVFLRLTTTSKVRKIL